MGRHSFVLRALLQVQVLDPEMHLLDFLMTGVRQEHRGETVEGPHAVALWMTFFRDGVSAATR